MKKLEIKESPVLKKTIMKNLNAIKMILFITTLVLVYFVGEEFAEFIVKLDIQIIKKAIDIILAAIVATIFFHKK